ncbi:MAG TPA: hypothetical protein VG474_10875, partial [Solirubrobacteraceae bacterium]|nr:hypothetical protein [Solirubrobacteraceae bacterium]
MPDHAPGEGRLRAERELAHNLPTLASFVGRAGAATEVAALLDKTALVTLTGPPGIGKSSLVLRVAYDVAPGYSGGAWLVELA